METMALAPELRAAAPAVAARLAGAILLPLAALIARAFLKNPCRVGIILPLWNRLTRAARRFDRLMAGFAAGVAPRPSRPGVSHGARPVAFPSRLGWLVADLRHEAAVYANRLDRLLAEPETAAIIAACPQAGRILRPLCRMLGVRNASLGVRNASLGVRNASLGVRNASLGVRHAAGPARPRARQPEAPPAIGGPVRQAPAFVALRPAAEEPPIFRPLRETVPCPHVGWPWFPHKRPGVA